MELMVAMVLGLMVLASVMGLYLASSQTARFQFAALRVQENGRFAIDMLTRTIRMAGYDDPITDTEPTGPLLSGTTASNVNLILWYGFKPFGDTVRARFEGGTEIRDCQGALVASDDWVSNTFGISQDNNLICVTKTNNIVAHGTKTITRRKDYAELCGVRVIFSGPSILTTILEGGSTKPSANVASGPKAGRFTVFRMAPSDFRLSLVLINELVFENARDNS